MTSRVFDLLDCFTAEHRRMTLSELSRRSGMPLSTAHRLTGELLARGALERDEAGRLLVGLRLWELGSLAPGTATMREIALPYLEDVYEATHENVQLAVLHGTEAVYLERISGRRSVHVFTRVGGRLPVHATGVGLVLLAHAPVDLLAQVLAEPLQRFTRHTITDARQLRQVLDSARRHGYVISDRQIESISLSVAAPVRHGTGPVVAALSVVVPSRHCDPRRLVPVIVTAARGISRRLGEVLAEA